MLVEDSFDRGREGAEKVTDGPGRGHAQPGLPVHRTVLRSSLQRGTNLCECSRSDGLSEDLCENLCENLCECSRSDGLSEDLCENLCECSRSGGLSEDLCENLCECSRSDGLSEDRGIFQLTGYCFTSCRDFRRNFLVRLKIALSLSEIGLP